ncbi:MAG: hypothetical protein NTZ69_00760 [Bacteroidia bacterium]|nr:hypothetical protein [Bacteroidia bacterium]
MRWHWDRTEFRFVSEERRMKMRSKDDEETERLRDGETKRTQLSIF